MCGNKEDLLIFVVKSLQVFWFSDIVRETGPLVLYLIRRLSLKGACAKSMSHHTERSRIMGASCVQLSACAVLQLRT